LWHRRREEFADAIDPHVVLDWYADEAEAWRLVRSVSGEYRHWRVRSELIERMAQWSVKYGFEPVQVSVPRFEQEATQEDIDDDLKDSEERLKRIHEQLTQMNTDSSHLTQLQSALRDIDFWHQQAPSLYLDRVCDVQAGLWQRLHEWIEGSVCPDGRVSYNEFVDAVRRAQTLVERPRHTGDGAPA
jgi:hypothetical protein